MKEIEHKTNFDLISYNTLRISSIAQDVYFPTTKEEFILLLSNLDNPIIIGRGSNLLLSSFGIKRPVIITRKLDKTMVAPPFMEPLCGAMAPKLSKMALELKLSGFEFLYPLPATIGGAVCMNAGACSQNISDTFISAEIYDTASDELLIFSKEDMKFEYRNSILKNQERYFLLSAKFKLNQDKDYDFIQTLMDENLQKREKSQPKLTEFNLGCVFKNPESNSAGKLLDECSLKSHSIGGATVSYKHANFIINFNNATSMDYLSLMKEMQNRVQDKFNIRLMPEIVYLGEDDKEMELWKQITK